MNKMLDSSDLSLNSSTIEPGRRRSTFYVPLSESSDTDVPVTPTRKELTFQAPSVLEDRCAPTTNNEMRLSNEYEDANFEFEIKSIISDGKNSSVKLIRPATSGAIRCDKRHGNLIGSAAGDRKPSPRSVLTRKPARTDGIILGVRKTPSMSSVEALNKKNGSSSKESTPKKIIKSQSKSNLFTERSHFSEMQIKVKEKSKTLPQNLHTIPPKSPTILKSASKISLLNSSTDSAVQRSPRSLGFIRRAHSTKLTRSNSFLKTLTTRCIGPSTESIMHTGGAGITPVTKEQYEAFFKNNLGIDNEALLNSLFLAASPLEHRKDLKVSDDDAVHSDTSYEKACRRGSAPVTPILGAKGSPTEHTPSRLANFFSKRSFRSNPLKRTKSVTKLERARRGAPGGGGLRGSRSHESLLGGHAALSTIELGCGDLIVAPVHSSVVGRRHCFEVRGGPRGPRYYCCASREERDLWIYSLRQSIHPSSDHLSRTDNSLKLWLLEAKALPPKKRYFCEVYLDDALYARTSPKTRTDILFWGELFELTDLPDVCEMRVDVYKEGDKKRKREKHALIGTVRIQVNELIGRYFTERWYPILSERGTGSLSRGTREPPTLRLKARYQSTHVRPLGDYDAFVDYLKCNYKAVCEALEPVIGVKAKEDIASALVLLMQSLGMAGPFLADVVALDLLRVGDQRLTFRGNSLATKAMEAFLKLTGEQYLQDTLCTPVSALISSSRDCEVDPVKAGSQLTRHQTALRAAVEDTWASIANSHPKFPSQIRECFATFRERLSSLHREDMADNLISASIFLRFLCPAILSPSLFNITSEYPDERAARNLTLVAKTLQTLANFTKFQGKEGFMEFLNDFLLKEASKMKDFLHKISARLPPDHIAVSPWAGHIDQGKQLSLLQTLLAESLSKVPPNKQVELQQLRDILDRLVANPGSDKVEMRSVTQDNIFRFNDPTVSNTIQISALPISEVKRQKSPMTTIITNNVQNGTISNTNHVVLSAESNVPADETMCNNLKPNKITTVYNTTAHYKKSPSLGIRATTLPRNTFGNQISMIQINDNIDSPNLIQIEPATAFVRKSPTPILKHNNKNRFNGSQASLINERLNYNCDNERVNRKTAANLDDFADLLNYVNQQNIDQRHVAIQQNENNNKGSNISIGQLSNVCSSGYQSITTQSQSSSPIDLTNPNEVVNKNQLKIHKSTDKKDDPNQNQNTSHISHPLAFTNPVYHMDLSNRRNKTKKIDELSSLSPSSSDENVNRNFVLESLNDNGLLNSPLKSASDDFSPMDTPSPIIRRNGNIRMPRTNPLISYRNQKNDYRFEEKCIDKHLNEIDRNIKDMANNCSENDNRAPFQLQNPIKFKRSNQSLDKISMDYGYPNYSDKFSTNSDKFTDYDYNQTRIYDRSHLKLGIPIQHSYSNNSLHQNNVNPNIQHSYSNTSLHQNRHELHNSKSNLHNNSSNNSHDTITPDSHHTEGVNHPHGFSLHQQYLHHDLANLKNDIMHHSNEVLHNSHKKVSRRVSVESTGISDSSSEADVPLNVSETGLSKTTNRSVEQCEREIERLQASVDNLRSKLQRAEERREGNKEGGLSYGSTDDNKMKGIIARLISVEEELRREQLKMSLALSHKQRVIEAQGQQIAALDAANSRLLSALSNLRHHYNNRGGSSSTC